MEEIKDLIKQEDYEKYKKLLQEFECKAIDIIEDLTYQFKETLAEDIDRKIKGWKDEYERLLKENWKKDDRIAELEQELAELKEKAIVPKFKIGQEVWAISVLRLNNIDSFIITEICYCADYGLYYKTNLGINLYEYYFDVFTTLEEAEKKLQELRGGE